MPSASELEELRALYDGQLTYVDEWIGLVLDQLKSDGLYDSALIVVTGDHGEAFGEHGLIHHSTTPYEELVHVPLLVKLPGSRNGGSRVATTVGLVDLLPTLVDCVGGETVGEHDGASFASLLEDPGLQRPERTYVSEYQDEVAIRRGPWKLVCARGRAPELYDLEHDPDERENRAESEPEILRQLAERLASIEECRTSGRAERVTVDDETVRQLEALGY